MVARLPIRIPRLSSVFAPAPMPITAIRPQVASAARLPRHVRAAHELEHDVERAVLLEALGVDRVDVERVDALAQLRVAHRGGDARARHLAELDRGHADAAGAAVDEQALAGAQPGLREEGVVRGGEDLGHGPRGLPVELLGHRHRGALVDDRELGLAAAGDDRHHAVAGLEALHAGPALDDLAGQLEAGDVLRGAGRRRVAALELVHVGAVEPGAADADEQVGVTRGPGRGAPRRRSSRPGWWPRASARWYLPGRSSGLRAKPMYFGWDERTLWVSTTDHNVPSPRNTADSADVAGVAYRPRGRRAASQPGLPRPRAARGGAPPGPADPRLHGRRRVARDDGATGCGAPATAPIAPASAPTSTAPRRPARRLEARLEHMAESPRRARRRRRPEPRRRLRPRARRPAAGARRRRSSRSARRRARCSPCTRSCSRRSASSARSAPPTCPGCSASAACAAPAARTSAAR